MVLKYFSTVLLIIPNNEGFDDIKITALVGRYLIYSHTRAATEFFYLKKHQSIVHF